MCSVGTRKITRGTSCTSATSLTSCTSNGWDYRNHTEEWPSPNLSPKLRAVFQNYFSVFTSESHFADRSTVDLYKNGDLLKLELPLRGKTALNFGDCFGEDHSLVRLR